MIKSYNATIPHCGQKKNNTETDIMNFVRNKSSNVAELEVRTSAHSTRSLYYKRLKELVNNGSINDNIKVVTRGERVFLVKDEGVLA